MNEVVAESIIRAATTVGVTLVVGSLAKLRLQASKEEQIFTNAPINSLRKILFTSLMLLFFFAYALFITSVNINSTSNVYLFFWRTFFNWYTFGIVLFVTLLLVCIRTFLKQWIRGLIFRSDRRRRTVLLGIFTFTPVFLFLVYSLYCGFIINALIAESNKIKPLNISNTFVGVFYFRAIGKPMNYYMLSTVSFYCCTVFLLLRFMNFVIKYKITALIRLKDGTNLYNKYILNYNLDNSILISDWESGVGNDKMLVPKANIQYIQFERNIYILDQQSPGSGIVDPRYFDKNKEAKLKKDFLNSVSRFL